MEAARVTQNGHRKIAQEKLAKKFVQADESRKIFGQALATARRSRGFSQTEIGEVIGQSQGLISHWEKGNHQPSPADVFALERALDLTPGTLSSLLGYMPPNLNATLSFEAVVLGDNGLNDREKEALIVMYHSLRKFEHARGVD